MQITNYKWVNWKPVFNIHNERVFSRMELFNEKISIKLGKKTCIGFFKDGKYSPCPEKKEVEHDRHCDSCKIKDDFFQCVKCRGECINPKRRPECEKNNYYVYLAAFDSLLKVGISYEYRLMERLVEQGADFGASIAFVKDGKNVRNVEQKIKNYLGIEDKIAGKDKHKALFGDPNAAAENIMNAINKLKGNGFNLIRPEIYDLRKYYKLENVLLDPEKIDIREGTDVSGSIVAAKGNILILKNNGFFSMNAHDMVGREIQSI